MLDQQKRLACRKRCRCRITGNEPCRHGCQPIKVGGADGHEFDLLAAYLPKAAAKIHRMAVNVRRYGQIEMPEWARATDAEWRSRTADPWPPNVDHVQLEIEYREVKRTYWDEFKSGSSEMGLLYKARKEENERKHGSQGVFEDLGRLWPEHAEEIAKSRAIHREIEIAYDNFWFKMGCLDWIVAQRLGDVWRNANEQIWRNGRLEVPR
ncbi:hypothetical protein EDD36DRAFT_480983 [Exophiala viscosa]|uniref:Uncharacterized protein n=1 Tax=Exophiala viscosa TaxID=2486360 RepID=A0AAN6IIS3_9EURO|nr:hypothetical protein EDD36DRAFT_480983 [Exophiala viscosa]